LGELVTLSESGAAGGLIQPSDDRYVVTWGEYTDLPGDAIWGTLLSQADGRPLLAPKILTPPAPFVRSHSLLDFGDRFLLVWGQWVDESYDLFTRFLDHDLEPLTEPVRLTVTGGNAVSPALAFSGEGTIGVAYINISDGSPQVYFTTLSCSAP
jgi:hypothetical protein